MFPTKAERRQLVHNCLSITLGTAIFTFAICNVHERSLITEGGIFGAVLLAKHWLNIPSAISSVVLDVVCYLLGLKFLGKRFLAYSLYASANVAVWYVVFEWMGPVLPSLAPYPLIAALVGGALVGIGVGMVVRIGAAGGGDDALALVLSEKLHWPISRAYMFADVVVLLLSLSYIPVAHIFYSLITVTVSSLFVGQIEAYGRMPGRVSQKAGI